MFKNLGNRDLETSKLKSLYLASAYAMNCSGCLDAKISIAASGLASIFCCRIAVMAALRLSKTLGRRCEHRLATHSACVSVLSTCCVKSTAQWSADIISKTIYIQAAMCERVIPYIELA